MFDIFGRLRALRAWCTKNRGKPRSIYRGHVQPGKSRPGSWALATLLFAAPAMADPPSVDYVASTQHDQRIELVRAAFHITHHPTEWSDFDPASVFAAPDSDRVSIETMIGGSSLQRKRAAEFILTTPAYARLVLGAYYPSVVLVPA